ncbi:MAG: hypothetical protein K2L19_00675 [Eubacterium sp.]|nr:hypothetical protein [Eubacterium sp.]
MIYLDELTNISNIQLGYLIACCVFFILYRIFISLTMYMDAKDKRAVSLYGQLQLCFLAFLFL